MAIAEKLPSEKRVIFLILLSDNPIYIRDMNAQKETWVKLSNENEKIFWVKGANVKEVTIEGSLLLIPIQEGYDLILEKTRIAMEWCIANMEFDILVRTNTSTYWNLPRLREKTRTIESENEVFWGYLETCNSYWADTKFNFISGAGMIFTKPAAVKIVKIQPGNYKGIPEDVAFSKFALDIGITMKPISRSNVHHLGIYLSSVYARLKGTDNLLQAAKRMYLIDEIEKSKNPLFKFMRQFTLISDEFRRDSLKPKNFLPKIKNVGYIALKRFKYKLWKSDL